MPGHLEQLVCMLKQKIEPLLTHTHNTHFVEESQFPKEFLAVNIVLILKYAKDYEEVASF